MKLKRSFLLFIALQTARIAYGAGYCSLAQSSQGAASRTTNANVSAMITLGRVAGLSHATSATLGVGPMFTAQGGYACFMSTNAPIGVAALLGTLSTQKMVANASRTMLLEWDPSSNPLPVTYDVYTSTNPNAVLPNGIGGNNTPMSLAAQGVMTPLATGLSGTSTMMTNLNYLTPYYWQVVDTDQFGRFSVSQIYSFSIAPVQDHFIAAPNPFHPGNGTTTLMWSMDGPGSVHIEIFSLPDARRVFDKHFDGLPAGVNLYTYDGRDNNGRLLGNGVFTIRLTKQGASSAVEIFKIISVR
jgi:hypothetical protein